MDEVKYTDCAGICGFCEIKDTCDNPKRLKMKAKYAADVTLLENHEKVDYNKLASKDKKNTVVSKKIW